MNATATHKNSANAVKPTRDNYIGNNRRDGRWLTSVTTIYSSRMPADWTLNKIEEIKIVKTS